MFKVAAIVPYQILPPVKGGEKAIYFFQKSLNHYTDLISFTVSENKTETSEINFNSILGSTRQKLRYLNPLLYFKIKKICKQHNIHHIIMEHPYYAWLGYALQRYAGIKWMIRSHNIESMRFKSMHKWWWKLMYVYEKFAHRHADFSFFITEEDMQFAITKYGVDVSKCAIATYGIETDVAADFDEKKRCKEIVLGELGVDPDTHLILFNGVFDYAPNRRGLDIILNEIHPLLQRLFTKPYKIIICGLRLPQEYKELSAYANQNIIYKGFVKDIALYFKAADVFINPIIDGGGIKTKLVEALAANTPVVSFKTGAYGVPSFIADNHLAVIENNDNKAFVEAIIKKLLETKQMISPAFYEYFNWNKIAKKVVDRIEVI